MGRRPSWLAALAAIAPAVACSGSGRPCEDPALASEPKRLAEALTSLFENGTTEIDYAYAEALGDGRGITAGRAGFTSATGDLLLVVQRYTEAVPGNGLATYLPRLEDLAAAESEAIDGLEGLIEAWAAARQDPAFTDVQDQVVTELYYDPSLDRAREVGACEPLSLAFLYDAIIQHGDGDDPDSLAAILEGAGEAAGGQPIAGVDEHAWLPIAISVRRADLAHAFDPATRDVWAESVGRCDVFTQLVEDGRWSLEAPLEIHSGGYDQTVE